MSYKQFIVELEDDILPGEAERRYGCDWLHLSSVWLLLVEHCFKLLI